MVAGCPKCSARYRVDAEKIGPEGAKLRCTKCSAVFLVRVPARAPAERQPERAPAVVAPPAPEPARQPVEPAQAPAASPPPEELDSSRLVLIADPDEDRAKESGEAVRAWGLTPHVVHDGVEAMLAIQRMLPAAVVLDAALPKMFGFQVCEVVKRNESLRDTRVVLVGAIHHQDRYRRDPSELYGADVYIEQPDLPEGLHAILRDAGLPLDGDPLGFGDSSLELSSPDAPLTEEKRPPVATVPTPEPSTPAPAAPAAEAAPSVVEEPDLELELELDFDSGSDEAETEAPPSVETPAPIAEEDPAHKEERERAERLARIAVSEMVLYQPEKFDQASQAGNLEQVLDLEIQEARALLRQRVSEEVRAETDFILDELHRVARDRKAGV